MKKCPSCGKVYSDFVKKCSSCNTVLASGSSATASASIDPSILGQKGNISEGSILRGIGGAIYKLKKQLAQGGEGRIYDIENGNNVAKIYIKDSAHIEAKINYMVTHHIPNRKGDGDIDATTLTWPIDALYDCNNAFVGYVMPMVEMGLDIFEVARESDLALNMFPGFNWMCKLKIAINLAATIEYVHSYNVVVGDMNNKNIMVNPDYSITLLDCDSFDITDYDRGAHYKCCVSIGEYLPPELQGMELSEERAKFTRESDYFALAIHIFQLLMGKNNHPFNVKLLESKQSRGANAIINSISQGLCPYVRDNSEVQKPVYVPDLDEVFPFILQQDFINTFYYDELTAKKNSSNRTSAAVWKEHLLSLYQGRIGGAQLVQCPVDHSHVYLLQNGKCCFCEAEKRVQEDFREIIKNRPTAEERRKKAQHAAQNIGNTNNGISTAVTLPTSTSATNNSSANTTATPSSANSGGGIWMMLAAALICVVGFWYLNYERPYQNAIRLSSNLHYEEALAEIEKCGDYKDSRKRLSYNALVLANRYYDHGLFKDAQSYFKKVDVNQLEDFDKPSASKRKLTNEKIVYINEHLDSNDEKTCRYLAELGKDGYPEMFDFKGAYNAAYSWKVKIEGIQSEDASIHNASEYEANKKGTLWFSMYGGEPDETISVLAKDVIGTWRGGSLNNLKRGDRRGLDFTYNQKGSTTITFYTTSGKKLGEHTIVIK